MGLRGAPLVEGDYIETVEGLFFAVKGLHHPRGRAVAYLRYLPCDGEGQGRGEERVRGGRRYARIYDLEGSTRLLESRYPAYLGHIGELGLTLQSVPLGRVARVYSSRDRLRELVCHQGAELERVAVRFARALSSESGVPIEGFGVSGSLLIGLTSPASDVDLVVHGGGEGRRVYEALRRLREASGWILPYDEATVAGVLGARWGETGLDLERLRAIEVRKVLHGRVSGRDYFVRLVKRPEEVEAEVRSRPLGRAWLRAAVEGAEESIFTPCSYRVRTLEARGVEGGLGVSELLSFRGKFAEQAGRGDIVEAAGTLEEVEYEDGTHLRLVMGGRTDYLIRIEGL